MSTDADIFASPDTGGRSDDEYIRNGRYYMPDPITGKYRYYSRASKMGKILADTYHLDRWNERMIMKGAGLRPDLVALAASLDVTDDKEELQSLADSAKEAAGSKVGANMGTALHKHCERLDGGEDMSKVPMTLGTRNALDVYRQTMAEYGFVIDPALMERIVLNKKLDIMGRLDRVLMDPEFWDLPRIGDLKTQKTMDFGALEIAVQLSIYANAEWMWNFDTKSWEEFPQMDIEYAHVMHLPVGKNLCEMFRVDIANGWRCAKLAMNVRRSRNVGRGLVTKMPNDREFRLAIKAAETVDDLSMVWRLANAVGVWNPDLEKYGKTRQMEIEAA
jgi:hypothetical protein